MTLTLCHLSRPQFVFLTYILGVAWLGVFGFSAVPVFLFYNMWSTCAAMRSPMANLTDIDSICVDVRQYGERVADPRVELHLIILRSVLSWQTVCSSHSSEKVWWLVNSEFPGNRNHPMECHAGQGLRNHTRWHLQHQWGELPSPFHSHIGSGWWVKSHF